MRRLLGTIFVVGLGTVALALAIIKGIYGGGQPFPDVSTPPALTDEAIEVIAELDRPPACIAVSGDGRVFFDLHAFGHPKRFGDDVLFEIVDGRPVPFPNAAAQKDLRAPFGITVDRQNRLWAVESGGLEGFQTRIVAFDLSDGRKIIDHRLPEGVGTFAQDLRVTPDGRTIVLADTGLFRFTEASLLVVDAATGAFRRRFSGHPSLEPEDYFIRRYDGAPHRLAYGLVSFQVGVDGLSISPDGEWLYYATMSHRGLYRLRMSALLDPSGDVVATIERVGGKPQSDGIEVDASGTVFLTDVENSGIATVDASGQLSTLIKKRGVIWADSVALGQNGDVYFTDSAIPAYVQPLATPPPPEVLDAHKPFRVYRIRRAFEDR